MKLRRIAFWLGLIGCCLQFGLLDTVHADPPPDQQPLRVYMVQWRGMTEVGRGFVDYLKKTSLPIEFTILDSDRNKARLGEIKERIRRERPNLIFTFGTTVTKALAGTVSSRNPQEYITDIPIVFGVVAAPVKAGIIPAFESSQINLTGVSHLPPLEMQLATIYDFISLDRLGVIYNPSEDNSLSQVASLEKLAKEHDFTLVKGPLKLNSSGVLTKESVDEALARLKQDQVDLVYLPSDSSLLDNSDEVKASLSKYGLPSYAAVEKFIRQGGALFGLVSNYYNVGAFCGYKAQQILEQGIDPRDIPVERLEKFTLLINMLTAREIEVYPPIDTLNFSEVVDEGMRWL